MQYIGTDTVASVAAIDLSNPDTTEYWHHRIIRQKSFTLYLQALKIQREKLKIKRKGN